MSSKMKTNFFKTLGGKNLLIMLGITVITIVVLTTISVGIASNKLKTAAFDKLEAVQKIKITQLRDYFRSRLELLKDVQKNLRFTGGIPAFGTVFSKGINNPAYKNIYAKRIGGLKLII